MRQKSCDHIKAITKIKTATEHICEECIKLGDGWVHLRTCQECGVTLCCDDSKNKHATAHFHATKHPVINSAEPNEKWFWCYTDNAFVTY